jgi:hypothetical protein
MKVGPIDQTPSFALLAADESLARLALGMQ